LKLQFRHLLIPTALVVASTPVIAQLSGGPFEISRSSIDGGGGHSTGGQFDLNGTIGQPEGGGQPLAGGAFELSGGFWAGGMSVTEGDLIFRSGFEEP
jgi:hypothetical protein